MFFLMDLYSIVLGQKCKVLNSQLKKEIYISKPVTYKAMLNWIQIYLIYVCFYLIASLSSVAIYLFIYLITV